MQKINLVECMSGKVAIKNVQARIGLELYDNIQQIIKQFNESNQIEDERLNIQKVIVEALNDWVRKNQKDSLLTLAGILKENDNN